MTLTRSFSCMPASRRPRSPVALTGGHSAAQRPPLAARIVPTDPSAYTDRAVHQDEGELSRRPVRRDVARRIDCSTS
jgi:hypothetical protein